MFQKKRIVQDSEIKESCVGNGQCEGMCRDKYYAICCAHQKYYVDYATGKPMRVYLPPPEERK